MLIFFYFLLTVFSGYLLSRPANEERASLGQSLVFGLGMAGLIYFLSLFIYGKPNIFAFIVFYLLFLALIIFLLRRLGYKIFVPMQLNLFDFAVLAGLIFLAFHQKYGYHDAWAIWNAKAKFLAFGGQDWKQLFFQQLDWMHPDYPLLLPSIVAGGWVFSLSDSFWVPLILGVLFSWALCILLREEITKLFNGFRFVGMSAVVILVSVPAFLRWAPTQYADIPLVACLLLGLKLLRSDKKSPYFFLSGFAFGLAVFMKNEGIFYVVIFLMSFGLAYILYRQKIKINQKSIIFWILGFAPGVIFMLAIKKLAPVNSFFLLDFKDMAQPYILRVPVVAKGFSAELFNWKEWTFIWLATTLFYIIGLFKKHKNYWDYFFSAFFMFIGLFFFFIYVFLPLGYDVINYLNLSFNRLLMQVLPLFIFYILFLLKNCLSEIKIKKI